MNLQVITDPTWWGGSKVPGGSGSSMFSTSGRPHLFGLITLRVHVPDNYILGAQSPYIGSTLRPRYSLFRYMDP